MADKEQRTLFAIPANYTDSGRIFGGMLEARNAIEALGLVTLVGYPELVWLHIPLDVKIIVMTVTLLPLAAVASIGIGGDSLLQYFAHIISFFLRRRTLHYRRIDHARTIKNGTQHTRKSHTKKNP